MTEGSIVGILILDVLGGLEHYRHLVPIGLVGLISWAVWLARWVLSRRYRPIVNDYRTTTSIVVPSYREDPEVLARCLDTWLREDPDEVVLVVDLADIAVLKRLAEYNDDRVCVIPFRHHGKRSALGVGIRAAHHDIVILVDSDTAWEPGLLAAIQMPFVNPEVGGVGTRQNVFERGSSPWRIVADWLVNTRYLDYVPAQSLGGGVACLSGRTAAYRRSAILPLVSQLEYEYFLCLCSPPSSMLGYGRYGWSGQRWPSPSPGSSSDVPFAGTRTSGSTLGISCTCR